MHQHPGKPRSLCRRIAVFFGNWLVMVLGGRIFRTRYDEKTLKKYKLLDDHKEKKG